MVILAGVIIVSAVADGGVIDRAQTALKEQERAEAQEIVETSYVYKTTASQTTYASLDMPETAKAIFNNLTGAGFTLKKSDGTEAAKWEEIYSGRDTIELNIQGKRSEYKGTVNSTGLKNELEIKEEKKEDDKEEDKELSDTTPSTDEWYIAYTCKDGEWSSRKNYGEELDKDADIVAKFYSNGETVTIGENELGVIEGSYPGYTLKIEGNGEIILYNEEEEYIGGWLKEFLVDEDNSILYLATEVIIGDGITSIGDRSFACWLGLKNVRMADTVTSIGNEAFVECNNLVNIEMSDNITSIGESAFLFCNSLESITIPKGVTNISSGMFEECESLESVNMSDNITSIGYSAFAGCESLIRINIPNSVKSIDTYAFDRCRSLESIKIPNGITSIGQMTFHSCESLTSIELPDSLTNIGESAFVGCKSLVTIDIPENVTVIGEGAFSECTNLKNVKIPNGVTDIGRMLFFECANLESIEIPDNVISIGVNAFYKCTSLKEIIVPKSMKNISYNAFGDCTSLKEVYYKGTQDEWNSITIDSSNTYLKNANKTYNYEK